MSGLAARDFRSGCAVHHKLCKELCCEGWGWRGLGLVLGVRVQSVGIGSEIALAIHPLHCAF